jgi:hypothetical protein
MSTPDMLFIVPSRGRPGNVIRLIDTWEATGAEATLCVAYDSDDYFRDEYSALIRPQAFPIWGICSEREKIGRILNRISGMFAEEFKYIGFMGDDHVPRTADWDLQFKKELESLETGIVYGNDLLMSDKMPTAVCMTSDIIRTLGYMAPPPLEHLCLDLVWKDWGEGINKLVYRDNVIIEHLHPANGKAELDELYKENNSVEQSSRDANAYYAYRDGTAEISLPTLEEDIEKLRGLL